MPAADVDSERQQPGAAGYIKTMNFLEFAVNGQVGWTVQCDRPGNVLREIFVITGLERLGARALLEESFPGVCEDGVS